jgi:adenylate kinase
MRIILLGAPGSGKGTQGDLLEKRTGFPRISTGDLLRLAVRRKTPLGLRAEAFMAQGLLVSDDVVEGLVRERIAEADCRGGYILDGFPRTIPQAEALAGMDGGRPEIVIGIEVDPEILIGRLSGRRICPACQAVFNVSVQPPARPGVCDVCGGGLVQRPDDTAEVIRKRIEVYLEQTAPLKDYYRRKNELHLVDGRGPIEEIAAAVARILDRTEPAAGRKTDRRSGA